MANSYRGASRLYFGNGDDGSITDAVDTLRGGVLQCTQYTLNPSVTITPTLTNSFLVIMAQNSITLKGTIDFSRAAGNEAGATQDIHMALSGAPAAPPAGGAPGIPLPINQLMSLAGHQTHWPLNGGRGGLGNGPATFNGGGGGGGSCIALGGAGGAGSGVLGAGSGVSSPTTGGGSVLLIAPLIIAYPTALIKCDGGNGTNGTGIGDGGSGGSAGGTITFVYQDFLDYGLLATANGGAGGAGGGGAAGGAGGTGFNLVGSNGANGVNGGGGGGGGASGFFTRRRIVP